MLRNSIARISVGVCAVSLATSAQSTVIEALSFQELAKRAALIVEAEIVSDSQRTEVRNGTPWTCQTFRISRVLKGLAGATKEVCFYGGKVGGYSFAAAGLTLPRLGRKGFFFLEDTDRKFTNPMVGWDQGGFYIAGGPSGDTVTTFSGDAIADIDLNVRDTRAPTSVPGAVAGVTTAASGRLSPETFVEITMRAIAGSER